ncbi:mitochondrial protein Pet127-domain-containing protein [Calycina marina]|uniref:Mitochondrial protein Pet127-domain-containing protein n=1 Tax=Calycina marina TaxID=1763456 RepID=A0A9P7Z442_9HELO|nr:mitochondrial protein Pet127-domain-containing protein [Calycina marina]
MLARGSSRIRPQYICTACRCHILLQSEIWTSRQQFAFSTSQKHNLRNSRIPRSKPEEQGVSPGNVQRLERLRTALPRDVKSEGRTPVGNEGVAKEDVEGGKKSEVTPTKKVVKKRKTQQPPKPPISKGLPLSVSVPKSNTPKEDAPEMVTEHAIATLSPGKGSMKVSKKAKLKALQKSQYGDAKPSVMAEKPEEKASVSATTLRIGRKVRLVASNGKLMELRKVLSNGETDDQEETQSAKEGKTPRKSTLSAARMKATEAAAKRPTATDNNTKPGEMKIAKIPGKHIKFVGHKPDINAEEILEAVKSDIGRKRVTKLIESGKLSPQDTVLAMCALRSTLIRYHGAEYPVLLSEEPLSESSGLNARDHERDEARVLAVGAAKAKAYGVELAKAFHVRKKGAIEGNLRLTNRMAAAVRNHSSASSHHASIRAQNLLKKAAITKKTVLIRNYKPLRPPPSSPQQEMTIKKRMTRLEDNKTNPQPTRRSRPPYERRLIAPGDPAEFKVVKTGPMFMTKAQKTKGLDIKELAPEDLALTPVDQYDQEPVPAVVAGLDRVLFNRGVVDLKDPRTRVYNFDPYLEKITPVSEFNFNALKEYKTSSRDTTLIQLTKDQGKKYTGSTSSMSSALAHFHFLLSQWRPITTTMLSRGFPVEFNTFTTLQRGPAAVFLRWRDGAYAIDADKQYDSSTILMMLGKSMEKLLTLPKHEYEKYLMSNADELPEEARHEPETFHYSTIGDFLLRSQLDAYDPRLPGTGMFDLKTRACISVRMDTKDWKNASGYEIRNSTGELESYEREYYDMTRAAFLKYSLQVRMGRMDGIFVAFHNTERIFGFQYISLNEMDLALHGTEDTAIGDQEFLASLNLLNETLDNVTTKYPEQSVRLHFETRPGETPFMYIFAEPMTEEQIDEIQNSKKEELGKFEEEVLGIIPKDKVKTLEQKKDAEWQTLRIMVEESVREDEMDIQEIRSLAENLLEESEHWDELSPDEKGKCIESLVMSATMSEDSSSSEEANETTLIGDAEGPNDDDVVEEDEDAEIEEQAGEEIVGEEEGDEEIEETIEVSGNVNIGAEEEVLDPDESALLEDLATSVKAKEEAKLEDSPEEQAEDKDEPTLEESAILEDNVPIDSLPEQHTQDTSKEIARQDQSFLENADSSSQNGELTDDIASTTSNDSAEGLAGDMMEEISSEESSIQSESDTDSTLTEDTDVTETSGNLAGSPEKHSLDDLYDLLGTKSTAPEPTEEILPTDTTPKSPVELLAMTLTIRNKINGEYVARPQSLTQGQKWTIEYALDSMGADKKDRAALLYEACKRRRYESLHFDEDDEQDPTSYNNVFMKRLKDLAKSGRRWRKGRDELDMEIPVQVFGEEMIHRRGGFVGAKCEMEGKEKENESAVD